MKITTKTKLIVVLFVGVSPLINCSKAIEINYEKDLQPSETPQKIEKTQTPNFLPSMTPESVNSIETILPTLSPNQKEQEVLELYLDNGGCELPCWWGIVPGETTIQDVQNRFSIIGKISEGYPSNTNPEALIYRVTVIPPKEIDIFKRGEWIVRLVVVNNTVKGITVGSWCSETFSNPILAIFLKRFGEPDEIWIDIVEDIIKTEPPYYSMDLFYPKQGILAAIRNMASIFGGL